MMLFMLCPFLSVSFLSCSPMLSQPAVSLAKV
jgi:hypothetical protein